MLDEKRSTSFLNAAVQKGLILGLISILIITVLYIVDYALLANPATSLVVLIIIATISVYFGRSYRSDIGGFISYGKAFQFLFLMQLISSFIQLLFNILLFSIIDPDLTLNLTREAIAQQENMMRFMSKSQDEIQIELIKLQKSVPHQFSVNGQIEGSLGLILVSSILASIFALFVKKNEPIING
ncbi:MAG: DUF4199 domain-containing protein [Cyclobacteriaceae bacterium]